MTPEDEKKLKDIDAATQRVQGANQLASMSPANYHGADAHETLRGKRKEPIQSATVEAEGNSQEFVNPLDVQVDKPKKQKGFGAFLKFTPEQDPLGDVNVPESFEELATSLDDMEKGKPDKDGKGETGDEGPEDILSQERWQTSMGEARKVLLTETDPKKIKQKFADIMMGNIVAANQHKKKIRDQVDQATQDAEAEVQAQITQQEEAVKDRNKELQQKLAKVEQIENEFHAAAKRGINPDQYFENRSNFNTIIGAIAIGMGAYGSAMTGTPNYALDIIKDAINRDVEAQMANLGAKKDSALVGQKGLSTWDSATQNQLNLESQIKGQKIASAKYFLESYIKNADKNAGDVDKLNEAVAGLSQWELDNVHVPKDKDPMEMLKIQQAMLNIDKTRQEIAQNRQDIAQKHRDTTVGPAALSGIPLLGDVPGAYLSGGAGAKKELREAAIEAKNSFARSAQLSKSVDQFKAMEAHTKYIDTAVGGVRKIFGRAPKEWARLHNDMKRNAALMVQPVRKLVFDKDPRLSETDMKIIQSVANSKSVDSWHSMFARAGMNKLQILQDTAKVIAVDNMAQLYRRAMSMIELPSGVRSQIQNLLKGDDYKTSVQKTEELYDYFKKAGL